MTVIGVPRATLRWLDLTAAQAGSHPTALDDIVQRRTDGLSVTGVFSAERCATAVARLEAARRAAVPAMFGEMLGVSLANLSQYSDDPGDRRAYLDDAEEVREHLRTAFDGDPVARLADVVGRLGAGRGFGPASEGGRDYLAGNLRWMEPGRGALPAHVGNEFHQQGDDATAHLRSVARIADHYSWFVVLQRPEAGGALRVFDRLHLEHRAAQEAWGADGRDDADFDDLPCRIVDPPVGSLVLFGGGWRWHRVDPIEGRRPRITFGGFAGLSTDGTSVVSWF